MSDVLFTNVRIFDGGGEAPFTGDVLVQGNRISRVVKTGYGQRSAPVLGATTIDGAGAFLMPGMVEAHTHFSLERPAEPRRHPAHAARGAHPVVRRGRQALPRHGLDQLRRRRRRQAAAGRRDPQCHQRRHHRRPALPGGQPGDHRARRPGRHHRAAPAAAGVRLRRDRQRRRGDAPLRAHVRQVRRRHAEDQPVGRVDHRHAQRDEPVHARGDRGVRAGGQGLGQARGRACAQHLGRSSNACATASRSSTTPASPTKRRSTCSRRTSSSTSSRPAWPG